jgi:hypothetical protein
LVILERGHLDVAFLAGERGGFAVRLAECRSHCRGARNAGGDQAVGLERVSALSIASSASLPVSAVPAGDLIPPVG